MTSAEKPAASDPHPMLEWCLTNLERGCNPNDMARTMLDNGWSWSDAAKFLELSHQRIKLSKQAPQILPSPRRELFGLSGCPDGQRARVLMHLKDPEVALVENIISPEEALAIIELGRARLKRSTTVGDDVKAGDQIHSARTSEGASLHDISHPATRALRARASWAFGCPEPNIEGLQILRYLPGQEYLPHQDSFDPKLSGGRAQFERGGQRLATAVIYLNDCPQGGATIFPQLGCSILPRRGNAAFFSYHCDEHGFSDQRLLHGGAPVESGEKWVCTIWMRERTFT